MEFAATRIFVHGVPHTSCIWSPLLKFLEGDVGNRLVSLPGFGCPLPSEFVPTAINYLVWLEKTIEDVVNKTGPVDIVGHDWGGGLVWALANTRPDLFQTWTIISSPVWRDYKEHFFARVWRTPVLGEISMAMSSRYLQKRLLTYWGVPKLLAGEEAAKINRTMRSSILSLYRSAEDIVDVVGSYEQLKTESGLFIFAEKDIFVPSAKGISFANRLNIECQVIGNAGHWAISEKPEKIASLLISKWKRS